MADKKWSQFPSATPENDDVVVGLHAGGNVRFTVANFVLAVRQGLINLFVPQTRTVNGKALSSDISLTMDDISNGTTYAKTTAAQVAQIGTNQANIGTIEGKIPGAASTSNQLADKAFVTDAITQGTAIFRGSFASRAALLAVAWQTTDPDAPYYVSNNDYAVVLDDETQNDECWRYIYVTGTGWTPQYRINESPLTQAQLDALNSGATAAIINSVADKLDKTGDGKDVTATFTAASTRANISTGEKLSVLFGKIAKWFSDLGTAAFRAATGSITSGSTDLVESGAVYTGLAGKQSTITASGILKGDGAGGVSAATAGTDYQAPLTIDATPTASSTNPVQSGGVYTDVRTRVPNYGKGKNLLDNSYFVGGGTGIGVFPVNQRGQSSYTGLVYGIDRWYSVTTGGTLTIGADYITLQAATYNFGWRQTLSRKIPIGSAVTITVLKGDGSLVSGSGTLSSSTSFVQVALTSGYIRAYYDYVQITTGANSSNTIKAIWLELGTEQTLCHNEGTAENPVWVLNEIPDYEYELYRCITSTADSSDTYANKSLATEQQTAPAGYGLGSYFAYLLTSSDNLNTVAEGGFYRWSSGSIPSNSPISGAGLLLNSPSNAPGHSATQVVSDLSNNTQYYRTYSDGWKNWKTLATEQQLAYVETGTTASRNYAVGEYFCWNGLLYRVTSAISNGQPFNPGSNCEQVTEGGLNAFLPSITNGTLDTTKVSGYAQAISAGSLHMVFFKLTTSVAVATTDTLVSFPSGTAPAARQQPLQFLFKRPADTAPTIRGDRAGAYLNTDGTITQSLSNALTIGTLLQGFFIWIG